MLKKLSEILSAPPNADFSSLLSWIVSDSVKKGFKVFVYIILLPSACLAYILGYILFGRRDKFTYIYKK